LDSAPGSRTTVSAGRPGGDSYVSRLGSIVFGTVTVSASTSADVAGVQFRYDGLDLAAEDTTAPYTATAYTNSVPNGPYTFTLVDARQ
jgi:hypothetical protein